MLGSRIFYMQDDEVKPMQVVCKAQGCQLRPPLLATIQRVIGDNKCLAGLSASALQRLSNFGSVLPSTINIHAQVHSQQNQPV